MQAQVDPNEDTEFNDALRAHGIIPPKAPSRSPSPEPTPAGEARAARLKHATVQDLDDELEDLKPGARGTGDDVDAEEQRLLALRRQRLEDLIREQKRGRFGRVYPIARQDYTREVTDASKEKGVGGGGVDDDDDDDDAPHEDGKADVPDGSGSMRTHMVADEHGQERPARKGTGVVCFLFKDGMETCRLVAGYLDTLAAKYPATKFVSIVGDKCIPNYPDRNLPTLLVYRNGELHRQIVGLRPEIGLDGMNTKLEDIELLLLAIGVIERSNVPGAQSYAGLRFKKEGENGAGEEKDEDLEEDEGFGGNRTKAKPSIRSQEEEDADLDWDL